MRHVGGEVNVAAVLAAVDIRAGAAVGFAAGPAFQAILARVARDRAAVGKRQRFLQRHVDALAGAGFARVANAGQRQHRRHRARHLISQMARRRALPFGVVALAVEKTAGGIGDRVAAFVMAIRPGAAKRRDRNNHQVRQTRREISRRQSRIFPNSRAASLRRTAAPTPAAWQTVSRSVSRSRSSTMLRLLVLAWINVRLRSGCSILPAKGGSKRFGSPPGGSTLMTSAPRSASCRVA